MLGETAPRTLLGAAGRSFIQPTVKSALRLLLSVGVE